MAIDLDVSFGTFGHCSEDLGCCNSAGLPFVDWIHGWRGKRYRSYAHKIFTLWTNTDKTGSPPETFLGQHTEIQYLCDLAAYYYIPSMNILRQYLRDMDNGVDTEQMWEISLSSTITPYRVFKSLGGSFAYLATDSASSPASVVGVRNVLDGSSVAYGTIDVIPDHIMVLSSTQILTTEGIYSKLRDLSSGAWVVTEWSQILENTTSPHTPNHMYAGSSYYTISDTAANATTPPPAPSDTISTSLNPAFTSGDLTTGLGTLSRLDSGTASGALSKYCSDTYAVSDSTIYRYSPTTDLEVMADNEGTAAYVVRDTTSGTGETDGEPCDQSCDGLGGEDSCCESLTIEIGTVLHPGTCPGSLIAPDCYPNYMCLKFPVRVSYWPPCEKDDGSDDCIQEVQIGVSPCVGPSPIPPGVDDEVCYIQTNIESCYTHEYSVWALFPYEDGCYPCHNIGVRAITELGCQENLMLEVDTCS